MKHSIIIVAYKAEEYLHACLESIEASDYDGEVIVVDNSPEALDPFEICKRADNVRIIRTGENLGFAEGCNFGARQATGDVLFFLNPDCTVYGDWAHRMEMHLTDNVGAVGPLSNYVAGGQNIALHGIAWCAPKDMYNDLQGREAMLSKLLIGFCLAIRRDVWEEMHGMDPGCFLGNDDLDLSWRLRRAGYKLKIAMDVYVEHAGHKSMEHDPSDTITRLLAESEAHLKEKLFRHYDGNPPTAIELWGVDFFATKPQKKMTLSVCIIARNESDNLTRLMPELWFADEVVIVDTGVDEDEQILQCGRAKVVKFPWVGDFAAARNESKAHATGEWIMWVDCDDHIPEETGRNIRGGLDNPSDRILRQNCFFTLQLENMVDGELRGESVAHPRIFPNFENIKWEGAVHETFMPAIVALGLQQVSSSAKIIHLGYDTAEARREKLKRNMAILQAMPETPQKCFDLGNGYASVEQWHAAFGAYTMALSRWEDDLTPMFREHLRYMSGTMLYRVGAFREAMGFLAESGKPEARFMEGECLRMMGEDPTEAWEEYLAIPERPDPYGSHRGQFIQKAREYLKVATDG